jgi:hypothetical protein
LWIESPNGSPSSTTLENFSDLKDVLSEVERLPNDVIDGIRSYHYKLTFNNRRFFENLTGESVSNIERDVLLNSLKVQGEIWASKKDFLIRKMNLNLSFTFPSDIIEQIASIFSRKAYFKQSIFVPFLNQVLGIQENKVKGFPNEQQILIRMEIKYSNFNKVIKIKKPEKSKKITEISEEDIVDSPLGQLVSASIYGLQVDTKDIQRKTDLRTIQVALEMYYNNNGQYPVSNGFVKIDGQTDILSKALAGDYLLTVPCDPNFPEYYYEYSSDGKAYELTCILEDETDPEGERVDDHYIFKLTSSGF